MSSQTRKTLGRAVGAGIAAFALACSGASEPTGGGDGGGNGGGNTPPPASLTVNMTSVDEYGDEANRFTPSLATIARNGTVTWTNLSAVQHNVTFSSSGAPMNIPDIGAESVARTFPTAGSYPYQCTNHSGMSGTITVVAP